MAQPRVSHSPLGDVGEGAAVELPHLGEHDAAAVGHLGELLEAQVHLELVPLLLQHDERHRRSALSLAGYVSSRGGMTAAAAGLAGAVIA